MPKVKTYTPASVGVFFIFPFLLSFIGRYDAKSPKKELAEMFFTFLTKENSKKERDKYLHQPFFLKFVGRNVTSPK